MSVDLLEGSETKYGSASCTVSTLSESRSDSSRRLLAAASSTVFCAAAAFAACETTARPYVHNVMLGPAHSVGPHQAFAPQVTSFKCCALPSSFLNNADQETAFPVPDSWR